MSEYKFHCTAEEWAFSRYFTYWAINDYKSPMDTHYEIKRGLIIGFILLSIGYGGYHILGLESERSYYYFTIFILVSATVFYCSVVRRFVKLYQDTKEMLFIPQPGEKIAYLILNKEGIAINWCNNLE
jgi:hypothetical protein